MNPTRESARRVIARLRHDPGSAEFVVQAPGGWRVVPEEVWIEAFGWWVRTDGRTISGGPLGYRYPGWIMRWRLRRLFRWWRQQPGVYVPPVCDHPSQTPVTWTQDGWSSYCRQCRGVVYHGDY